MLSTRRKPQYKGPSPWLSNFNLREGSFEAQVLTVFPGTGGPVPGAASAINLDIGSNPIIFVIAHWLSSWGCPLSIHGIPAIAVSEILWNTRAGNKSQQRFTITEKAPTRAISLLKVPANAFAFKLGRHRFGTLVCKEDHMVRAVHGRCWLSWSSGGTDTWWMFRLGRCAGELECVVSHGSCRKCRTAHHGRSVPVSAPAQTQAAAILHTTILQVAGRATLAWG